MFRTIRNLLLLEVLAVVVFVGLIAGMLLNRLVYYQEAAEKANMELVISSIRSGLRMRMASMMIEGRMGQYSTLAQENPMDWLERKPTNYAGEAPLPLDAEKRAGNWVFDKTSRTLVYWPEHVEYFQPDSAGLHRVRLRVVLITEKIDSGNAAPLVTGARLVLVEPYKWF